MVCEKYGYMERNIGGSREIWVSRDMWVGKKYGWLERTMDEQGEI